MCMEYSYIQGELNSQPRDRRGRDHMVVGFTTNFAISAYHN